jgi:hypothetical protein
MSRSDKGFAVFAENRSLQMVFFEKMDLNTIANEVCTTNKVGNKSVHLDDVLFSTEIVN